MIADWVAVTTRGRALSRRRLGRVDARRVARSPSLGAALAILANTPYGRDVRLSQNLAEAQRAVYATLLWHLRVLAGWAPPRGAERIRALASGFEIANIVDKLAALEGRDVTPPFALGALATSWRNIEPIRSQDELRHALAACGWGDPGGVDIGTVRTSLQTVWARRVAVEAPEARGWALSFAMLLLARMLASSVIIQPDASAARNFRALLGRACTASTTLAQLRTHAPSSVAWIFEGLSTGEDLWKAEMRWWNRLESEALVLTSSAQPTPATVVGLVGLLCADAWMTRAALEVAARGGLTGVELFDAAA